MDDRLDVDARFLLANERTLLAWLRTGLTLMAAGAAVAQFVDHVAGREPIAVSLIALGVAASVLGAARHAAADRAIREGVLPRTGAAPYFVVAAVAVTGVALSVAVLVT